ncbi:MAG: ABC transporter substrate-binding protein [Treponema sp.]|nr:ABC transporter substrate-binding protein [Treponema sp.]
MKRLLIAFLLLSMLMPAFAGGNRDRAGTTVPQDFIYGVAAGPAGLDPHINTAHASILVHKQIYNKLLRMDEHLNFHPELAERWTEGPGNTYTFYLRRGVRFHNGREMVADDVVYSYNRMMDPALGSVARAYFSLVERVEAVDNYTVRFTLSGPDAIFLQYVTSNYSAIVPREEVERHGDLNNVPVGTGPFMFRENIPGNRVVLERNPHYFIPNEPRLDTLTFAIMPDESARLNALRTGAIHLAVLPPTILPLVRGNNDIIVRDFLSANYDFIGFNLTEAPFNDIRVRQAISLLIDRQEIITAIYDGYAQATGPVPRTMEKWAVNIDTNEFYIPDVQRARTLLTQAGFPNGIDVKITAGITRLTTQVSELLVSQLARGGVRAELEILETAQFVAAWRDRTHQTMVSSNGGGADPDRSIGLFFHSGSATNVWGYVNPRIDQLVEAGRIETDENRRHAIYAEAQTIILRELPNIFFVSPSDFHFHRANVEGYMAETYHNEWFNTVWLR